MPAFHLTLCILQPHYPNASASALRLHSPCLSRKDRAAQLPGVDSTGQWGAQTCPASAWSHRTRVRVPKGAFSPSNDTCAEQGGFSCLQLLVAIHQSSSAGWMEQLPSSLGLGGQQELTVVLVWRCSPATLLMTISFLTVAVAKNQVSACCSWNGLSLHDLSFPQQASNTHVGFCGSKPGSPSWWAQH